MKEEEPMETEEKKQEVKEEKEENMETDEKKEPEKEADKEEKEEKSDSRGISCLVGEICQGREIRFQGGEIGCLGGEINLQEREVGCRIIQQANYQVGKADPF